VDPLFHVCWEKVKWFLGVRTVARDIENYEKILLVHFSQKLSTITCDSPGDSAPVTNKFPVTTRTYFGIDPL
jgi:hypothetical protein